MIWHEGPPPYQAFGSFGVGQRHAVFTRLGGVSEGPFASLNQSLLVGDDPKRVLANQRRAQAVLHCSPEQVVNGQQVHGCHVAVVTAADGGTTVAATDGLVTADRSVVLTMRYADCVPVLLYSAARRVIGLAHAGWRGTVQGVAAETALVMMRRFGCAAQDLVAGIGPSIGPCCYQVGPEVVQAFEHAFPGAQLLSDRQADGRARVDLQRANALQLSALGIHQIEISACCTSCRRDLFFSHRGDRGRTGRFGAWIGLE